MTNEPLRVLIADDHPLFRNGMRALLAADPDTEVAGEATTGDEAVALAATLQPDVILMDIQMPGVSGIEATRQILHTSPHIRILVVTMFEDDHSVFTAMRSGAHGYVLKGARDQSTCGASSMDSPTCCGPAAPGAISPRSMVRGRRSLGISATGGSMGPGSRSMGTCANRRASMPAAIRLSLARLTRDEK